MGNGGHLLNAGDKGIRTVRDVPDVIAKRKKESHTKVQKLKQSRKKRGTFVDESEDDEEDTGAKDDSEFVEYDEPKKIEIADSEEGRKVIRKSTRNSTRRASRPINAIAEVNHVCTLKISCYTDDNGKDASEVRIAADALLRAAAGSSVPISDSAVTTSDEDASGFHALLEAASVLEQSDRASRAHSLPFSTIPDSDTEDEQDAQIHTPLFFSEDDMNLDLRTSHTKDTPELVLEGQVSEVAATKVQDINASPNSLPTSQQTARPAVLRAARLLGKAVKARNHRGKNSRPKHT